jgi:hypothetical protein
VSADAIDPWLERVIACRGIPCVDLYEVARSTGRFPQLVHPRGRLNGSTSLDPSNNQGPAQHSSNG